MAVTRLLFSRLLPQSRRLTESKLLDVDPGEATNRTVVTFVGEPEAVLEAAFQGVKKAAEDYRYA